MAASRFGRRILTLVGLGVGMPAVLLAVFGVFLATVSALADYSRIATVLRGDSGPAFVRRWWPSVASLVLTLAGVLVAVFVVYGVGETSGGSRVAPAP